MSRSERSRIPQLSPITEHVYITGANGVQSEDSLKEANVTNVLSVAREFHDNQMMTSSSYPSCISQVYQVSLRDAEDEDLLPHLDELADHIHDVVQSGEKIAVHCVAGVSRSTSAVLAYLMKHRGMTLRDAFEMVKEIRPVVDPNNGFWRALIEFEMRLKGRNSVEMLPFICGTAPSIDTYRQDMLFTMMRMGWIKYIIYYMVLQCVMVLLQMASVYYTVYD